jgi:hypothetical protein
MVVKGGPKIVSDGLVFNLDTAGAVSDRAYPINGLPVEYLIVAGGGGGGGVIGGGGGAGGLLHGYTRASLSTGSYTVTVGAGGAGGTGWNTSSQDGKVGGNSSAFSVTSTGGGGGDHHGGATSSTTKNGGSGGGGANGSYNGGTGISGQGNNGGNNGNGDLGAGGGGAGGVGTNAGNAFVVNSKGGNGGIGRYFGYSFGRSLGEDGWFAGGGGGGVRSYRGPYIPGVGSSGAGSGGFNSNDANINGNASANTGSGGGGGGYNVSYSSRSAGNGGSGVVIIKYKGPQKATGGDSIITRRGYTIHVFTSSGTFTVGGRVGGLSTSKIVGTLNNMGSSNYSSANKGYFTFDGSNEYINLNTTFSDYIGVSLPTTWEAFVYLNTSNNNETIIGSAWATGGVLFRKTGSPHTPSNRIRFLYFTNGSNGTGFDSQSTFASGWHHFVATYNGSGLSYGNFNFYHNGIIANITNPTFGTPTTIPNRTFNVGGISAENAVYWSGNIAYVKLYNKLLSADQILDNYNATKGRFGL